MRRALAPIPLALLALAPVGCASDDGAERKGGAPAQDFPAWFAPPDGAQRSAALEEAAAMLCARDTDAVIGDDVRRVARVWEGQVAGRVERDEPKAARSAVQDAAPALLRETRGTHLGVAEGRTPGGAHCVAIVASRQALALDSALPEQLAAPEPFPLSFDLPEAGAATIFLMRPDGSVERMDTEGRRVRTVIEVGPLEGRYVLEVITSAANDDPEVALLWPLLVGAGQVAPTPAVLFGDDGHSDLALTRRTEALVHRLRTTQEIAPLKIATPLSRLAQARAEELAQAGRLGHRLPDGESALEALRQEQPGFGVRRLAEVQGQAGSLDEAWGALLDSPAHRYELVYPRASHLGAAIVRGQDGFGRPLITVVMLVARRVSSRSATELRTELLGKLNLARDLSGREPLRQDAALSELAARHARAMAERNLLDDTLDGALVTKVALDASSVLEEVRVIKAVLDDPLRLAPSSATMNPDAQTIGIGLAAPGPAGQWYVSVLIGTPN